MMTRRFSYHAWVSIHILLNWLADGRITWDGFDFLLVPYAADYGSASITDSSTFPQNVHFKNQISVNSSHNLKTLESYQRCFLSVRTYAPDLSKKATPRYVGMPWRSSSVYILGCWRWFRFILGSFVPTSLAHSSIVESAICVLVCCMTRYPCCVVASL
jgi:hypothetical protein